MKIHVCLNYARDTGEQERNDAFFSNHSNPFYIINKNFLKQEIYESRRKLDK